MPKVTIVDENLDLRLWVKDVAELVHFQLIDSFDDSTCALKRLPLCQPEVVLIDLCGSKVRGFEFIQKVKTLLPDIGVIAMTTHPDTYSFFRAMMAGSSGFLEKPFGPDELKAAITDVVEGRYAFGSSATPHLLRFFKHLRHATQKFGLTEREEGVLACVFAGLLNKEIADTLKIGSATVHTHLHRLFVKFGVHSRKEVITKYLQQ